MPIVSKKPTDKEMGIVTVKIREEVHNRLEALKVNPEYKKIYNWSSFSDVLNAMIDVFDTMESIFIKEYIDNLKKCNECPYLNKTECRTECNVRKIFTKLDECQNYARSIFK